MQQGENFLRIIARYVDRVYGVSSTKRCTDRTYDVVGNQPLLRWFSQQGGCPFVLRARGDDSCSLVFSPNPFIELLWQNRTVQLQASQKTRIHALRNAK